MGLVRENVYLYDVQISTCLVNAYEDYNCFGEVKFFCHVKGFKMEQRAAIMFFVKLKKTATDTFEMLKSMYGEECYQEQVCLNGTKCSKKGESRYKTMNGKANVDCIF
jgi:hypothetical protein